MPFAFHDYSRSTPAAEEGAIQLPFEAYDIAVPPNAVHADRPMDTVTPVGSFYGRRDFENRQDMEDTISNDSHFGFKDVVLEHIRSRTRSDSSDTDDDHEDSE